MRETYSYAVVIYRRIVNWDGTHSNEPCAELGVNLKLFCLCPLFTFCDCRLLPLWGGAEWIFIRLLNTQGGSNGNIIYNTIQYTEEN